MRVKWLFIVIVIFTVGVWITSQFAQADLYLFQRGIGPRLQRFMFEPE